MGYSQPQEDNDEESNAYSIGEDEEEEEAEYKESSDSEDSE